MSRKLFLALANAIASIENCDERKRAAHLIREVCQDFNWNFDWLVWYNACKCCVVSCVVKRN